MNFYKYTNIGPRELNEDALYANVHYNTVFASIADGVGGLPHGDFASNYAIDKFINNITAENKISFKEMLIQTNDELEKIAKEKFNVDTIGTTFSCLYANKKKIKGIHVGDSRIILIRNGEMKFLTTDHSELGRLIRENKLSQKDSINYSRKNILEFILGNKLNFSYMEFDIPSMPNDRIIISTDGFHETVSDEIILRISNKYKSLKEVHRKLINEVENRVLRDNTSFICIEL